MKPDGWKANFRDSKEMGSEAVKTKRKKERNQGKSHTCVSRRQREIIQTYAHAYACTHTHTHHTHTLARLCMHTLTSPRENTIL